MNTKNRTGYVYSDDILKYRFNNEHPFNQMRLKLTTELLLDAQFLTNENILEPRIATDDEIGLIHKYDYIQAIKHASHGILSAEEAKNMDLMKILYHLGICIDIVHELSVVRSI